MSTPTVPEGWPDPRTFILPSRVYLLSFRDLSLPARRAALADSRAHFDEVGAGDDHDSQLALLGVIGDAWQAIEDVGVLGNALMEGFEGLSFYVKATVYNSSYVNNFYSQMHNRPKEYFLRLAALRIGDRSLHELFDFKPALEAADLEAIAAAEDATANLLSGHLATLARAWDSHRQLFHAYKHAALLANPQDVQIVKDRQSVVAKLVVWRRRRDQPELGTSVSAELREIADRVIESGELALDAAAYIVDTRLAAFDWIRFTDDGGIEQVATGPAPWEFWLRRHDVAALHLDRLSERFGFRFEQPS